MKKLNEKSEQKAEKSKKRDKESELRICAWCEKRISNNTGVFGVGVKKKLEIDLSEKIDLPKYDGGIRTLIIELKSENKNIYSIIPAVGSKAHKEGNDLVFMLCSMECLSEFCEALNRELHLNSYWIESFRFVNFSSKSKRASKKSKVE